MQAKIIKIGNSKGVRIPKALLEQSKLGERVTLEVRKNSIVITPDLSFDEISGRELAVMSEPALSDWNSPEEDEAWAHLQ
ncbi:MAG: AbrB/MazE/SpoVT family DNA-binding domain-containing protein [Candidatus Saccharibacteria bacterium]|nr:AbrB/MazE/SpoVT family DNA-binding domain-containing protein [Candidatus Saccharibacteria bacterium]